MSDPRRLKLHEELEEIIGEDGKVYYNPDMNVKLRYPCIVYELDDETYVYSENMIYYHMKRFKITLMDTTPESPLEEKIRTHGFKRFGFDRRYLSDGIYHTVYIIYV